MRSKRNLGPRRIQTELIRLHEFKLSRSTIWKVLNRHGTNRLRSGRAQRQPKSYSRGVPGERADLLADRTRVPSRRGTSSSTEPPPLDP